MNFKDGHWNKIKWSNKIYKQNMKNKDKFYEKYC